MVRTLAESIYFGCLRFLICRLEKPLDQSTSPRWSHSSLRRCLEVILTKTAKNTHGWCGILNCRYDLELWLGGRKENVEILSAEFSPCCWSVRPLFTISPSSASGKNMRNKWETSSQSSADVIAKNILASKNQPIVLLEREKRISRLTRGSFTCWHLPSNWTSFSLRESHIHSWERTGSISKNIIVELSISSFRVCSSNSDSPPHISSVTRT